MKKPDITFFCELNSPPLESLFENRFVIDDLKTLNAKLSMGIIDLSDGRTQVVKKLNKMGIKLIAWLLLPMHDGYWFNANNFEKALLQYDSFKVWSEKHKLQWDGIGLDIEPDIKQFKNIKNNPLKTIPLLIQQIKQRKKLEMATEAYKQLVDQIHRDGFWVETYHFPFISDERKARSTVLQRMTGLVDINSDSEVLMLYSSFMRPFGHTMLWNYGNEADSIGIGNTGGGVDLEGVIDVPALTWKEFSDDLRLAYKRGKPVHIFCLEGCVAQGFLERLITFDWDSELSIPKSFGINIMRGGLQGVLWSLQRPWVILAAIITLITSILIVKKKKDK